MPSRLKNIFNLGLILAVPPENTALKQLVAVEQKKYTEDHPMSPLHSAG
jgi:hypothetical protein